MRDHGVGVEPSDQAQLFERLSTADRNPGSVGLGLWIVKILAEAHGGDVGYLMTEAGPEFQITLPAEPPAT